MKHLRKIERVAQLLSDIGAVFEHPGYIGIPIMLSGKPAELAVGIDNNKEWRYSISRPNGTLVEREVEFGVPFNHPDSSVAARISALFQSINGR